VAQVSEVMDEIVAGEERQRQGMEQINTAIELRQLVSAYALTATSRSGQGRAAQPARHAHAARPPPALRAPAWNPTGSTQMSWAFCRYSA